MINRSYKLAYNFNTVELEFDEREYITVLEEDEIAFDEDGNVQYYTADETDIIGRILQREFDILTNIDIPIPIERPPSLSKTTPQVDPPSPAQIRWAKNLGMKNPENHSRREVAEFIERNK